MKRMLVMILVLAISVCSTALFAERIIFVGTIPLNGRIDLQERFQLDIIQQTPFAFTSEIAGKSYEIANYEFFSNSSDTAYRIKLVPADPNGIRQDLFQFRNVDSQGRQIGTSSIPFRLSIFSPVENALTVEPMERTVEKPIGVVDGARAMENGTILISFPTRGEGFVVDSLPFGSYEASVLVEVAAD